jgi:hypothetical protein
MKENIELQLEVGLIVLENLPHATSDVSLEPMITAIRIKFFFIDTTWWQSIK